MQPQWDNWLEVCVKNQSSIAMPLWMRADRIEGAEGTRLVLDTEQFRSQIVRCAITDGTSIKVYPIGAGCWCWDEVAERRLS